VAVLISYVDNGTIIVQSDTWGKNLVKLKLAYKIVFGLTQSMGLVLEHSKSEGFHFSQKHGDSNPDIDFGYAPYTGATPLHPGTTWQYLGFFFDCALTFREHVKRYTNKALTTVRAMLALSNSVRGLQPKHNQMQYRACVLPIATYGSRLWLYKGVAMKGPLDSLHKMQRHAWGLLKHSWACSQSTFMLRSWWSGAMSTPMHWRPHMPSADLLMETTNSPLRPLRAKSMGT
jgi:hypothetical protein